MCSYGVPNVYIYTDMYRYIQVKAVCIYIMCSSGVPNVYIYTDMYRYIQVKAVYDSNSVQGFVAILIFGNFLANAAQVQ
jgi:hypothetical protein